MNYNLRMTIYPRKRTDRTTGILDERYISKYHLRIETLRTLDESHAAVEVARTSVRNKVYSVTAPLQ